MYRLENDFFTYSNIFLLTHLFMPSMEKINRIKTLLTIKVPEGITFVAGYFFLTMLVKLVLPLFHILVKLLVCSTHVLQLIILTIINTFTYHKLQVLILDWSDLIFCIIQMHRKSMLKKMLHIQLNKVSEWISINENNHN